MKGRRINAKQICLFASSAYGYGYGYGCDATIMVVDLMKKKKAVV